MEVAALARVLKQVREEAGLSQKRLSLQLGKYYTFVWNIESGHTVADFITILDIAQIAEVEPIEIFNRALAEIKREREEDS